MSYPDAKVERVTIDGFPPNVKIGWIHGDIKTDLVMPKSESTAFFWIDAIQMRSRGNGVFDMLSFCQDAREEFNALPKTNSKGVPKSAIVSVLFVGDRDLIAKDYLKGITQTRMFVIARQ